ncbi:MAG: hypothetical protein H7Y12_06560 [Sphingobacteriaceae bacterium]|nr:hypothetical protein [Cytophagaceae bacterium]
MNIYNQSVRLTFSYKIGKMTFAAPKRKTRSVSNDDVKGDGGGEGGQQQAPAAGTAQPRSQK